MALLSTLSNSNSPCGEGFCAGLLGPAPSTASGVNRSSAAESRLVNGAEMKLDGVTRCTFFIGGGGNDSFFPGSTETADPAELGRSSENMKLIRHDTKLE
jgi:hypothetical protein